LIYFFSVALVGQIMARHSIHPDLVEVAAFVAAARRLVHPGTLVFLGLAR
jgi:hypothetical protein